MPSALKHMRILSATEYASHKLLLYCESRVRLLFERIVCSACDLCSAESCLQRTLIKAHIYTYNNPPLLLESPNIPCYRPAPCHLRQLHSESTGLHVAVHLIVLAILTITMPMSLPPHPHPHPSPADPVKKPLRMVLWHLSIWRSLLATTTNRSATSSHNAAT